MRRSRTDSDYINKILNCIFVIVLLLYPLRHIAQGISLTDTGYNYANFEYMGFEHMDPMWLFSTYLANVVGHFITKLPFAIGLVGMNFYTGLFVSGLGIAGYLFCVKKLDMPIWTAFVGEMIAVNLCWCPTALLYNYLTYVFFLACVMLLYCGLTSGVKNDKAFVCRKVNGVDTALTTKGNIYLFLAGVCLGMNVFVRFSNLPEAALIIAVWAYSVVEWSECRKSKKSAVFLRQAFSRTLVCLLGYLTALLLLFSYIHLRYGLDNYIYGIKRLFAMTDNAADYKADSMLMGIVEDYRQSLYWSVRMAFFLAVGMFLFALAGVITECVLKRFKSDLPEKIMLFAARLASIVLAAAMILWLCIRGFCSVEIFSGAEISYGQIMWPSIVFLSLTMLIAAIRIFSPKVLKEEKLISGMLILVILLTSIGSNNKTFPSWNNMFIAAPYCLWQVSLFIKRAKDIRVKKILLSPYPIKCALAAFILLVMFQAQCFGLDFVFAEGTGAQNMTAQVYNNDILKGVKMQPERAVWMTDMTDFVEQNNLKGGDVILYGFIPSLSFYLQMPSAFNPWSDLTSYGVDVFCESLYAVSEEMQSDASYRPAVILEDSYADCLESILTERYDLETLTKDDILKIIFKDTSVEPSIQQITAAEKFVPLIKLHGIRCESGAGRAGDRRLPDQGSISG